MAEGDRACGLPAHGSWAFLRESGAGVLPAGVRAPKDGAMAALISRGIGAATTGRSRAVVALAAAAMVAAAACGPARAQPQRRASEFWLDNGMQVVVLPDHRAPVVTHVVWYRVGGADNAPGQSGIAHFLEHLMFRSTKKLKSGELERTVSRLGGRDNAVTSHDATYYFQRLPN